MSTKPITRLRKASDKPEKPIVTIGDPEFVNGQWVQQTANGCLVKNPPNNTKLFYKIRSPLGNL